MEAVSSREASVRVKELADEYGADVHMMVFRGGWHS